MNLYKKQSFLYVNYDVDMNFKEKFATMRNKTNF